MLSLQELRSLDPSALDKLGLPFWGILGRADSIAACSTGGGLAACAQPLHRQAPAARFLADPRKLIFASTTQLGLTWGHEQWVDPKRSVHGPGAMLLPHLVINNVNNTVHSTSFMMLKNNGESHALTQGASISNRI